MSDFSFLNNPYADKWVISAARRAKRPNESKGTLVPVCPFCPGMEKEEPEVYRVGGRDLDQNWQVRVIPNKFPFVPIHEVVICSPDHHKGIDELPLIHLLTLFEVYRQRFQTHQHAGSVYIFHNAGGRAGESILHPHTQIAVIPPEVQDDIPRLKDDVDEGYFDIEGFQVFCPKTSQWPDEVWIRPTAGSQTFGDISDHALGILAKTMQILIKIFSLRHGDEFPFNFYIYPRDNWYVRIVPRQKTLGGFEVGTGIMVNTQDPKETFDFITTHFHQIDEDLIRKEHQAAYTDRM